MGPISVETGIRLELDDIQRGAFSPRPSPYAGVYILLRIDDRRAGRELLRRLIPLLAPGNTPADTSEQATITAAITFQGLKALGVPQDSLDSFAAAFQQGMAARAAELGDVGESAPEHWESPLGTPEVHVAICGLGRDAAHVEAILKRARDAYEKLPGIKAIWRQDCYALPNERTSFGFKDGISHPAIDGSGIPGSNPKETPIKAGEFILGYMNEMGELPPTPQPEVLGKNGTYVVFRKLHTQVAAFRQYLRAKSTNPAEEQLLAAKFVGRWPSGAPLALAPERDDPELGADARRNNDFLYQADDPKGLKCPLGAHARRMNARDAEIIGNVRRHRLIRRSTSYGPMLPQGVMEDDGVDRGIVFVAIGADLDRQFEFVKTEWVNDGLFIGAPGEKDPLVGPNDGSGQFTIPQVPIRRRLQGLPPLVVTRGGEYCFAPGLNALRWLAALNT
jgi:Dyp-type peroxidase family